MANVKKPLDEESVDSPPRLLLRNPLPKTVTLDLDSLLKAANLLSNAEFKVWLISQILQSNGTESQARGFGAAVAYLVGFERSHTNRYLKNIVAKKPGSLVECGQVDTNSNGANMVRAGTHATPQETRQDQTRLVQSASSAAPQPRSLEEVQSLWPSYFSPLKGPKPEETASARARATSEDDTPFGKLTTWAKAKALSPPSKYPTSLANLLALVNDLFDHEGPQVLCEIVDFLGLSKFKETHYDDYFAYIMRILRNWCKNPVEREHACLLVEAEARKTGLNSFH